MHVNREQGGHRHARCSKNDVEESCFHCQGETRKQDMLTQKVFLCSTHSTSEHREVQHHPLKIKWHGAINSSSVSVCQGVHRGGLKRICLDIRKCKKGISFQLSLVVVVELYDYSN